MGSVIDRKSANTKSQVSAFNDNLVSDLVSILGLNAVYGLHSDSERFTASGGGVTIEDSQYVLTSGTSAGGYATLWSKRPIVYMTGLGIEARLTAAFTTGIADSTQLCGLFSSADGMLFGYNGADFGVMHRYGGEFEVRSLQVTGAAGGAETVTVTLNGTAYNASVTAGTVQQNAHEIEVGLNATAAADSWYIQHIDDTVLFVFRGVGAKSGSYSVSSTGTLTGSITQTNAGGDATEDWTLQASWNKNTAPWLDTTKSNVFKVEYGYLGYGPLNYYIMDPGSKEWILVHQVSRNNSQTTPNFSNPSLRVGWATASLGSSGTALIVKGASAMAAVQGKRPRGEFFGMNGQNTSLTTETQILTCQVRREFGGKFCNAIALPNITCSTDSTKGMIFNLYINPTVAGITNHQYVDESDSICLYDTAGTNVSGGQFLGSYVVGPSGRISINNNDIGAALTSGDSLVITAQTLSGGAAAGGYATINVEELS